jgi:hypothetical protein
MDEVAALLGNSRICKWHYAKWDVNRQNRLDAFMEPEVRGA